MRTVGLKQLKKKLSEYIRIVSGGEAVLVTDRDRVVAEIVPPRPGRSPFVGDARLAEAVRTGWFVPPPATGEGPPPRLPVAPLDQILQELQEDGHAR